MYRIGNLSVKLLLLLVITLAISCKKKKSNRYPDNGLPPVTSTGENVFACYRDDVPWISKQGRPDMEGIYKDDTVIAVGTVHLNNTTEQIRIVLNKTNFPAQVNYPLNDTNDAYVRLFTNGFSQCFHDSPGYGHVSFKKIANGSVTLSQASDKVLSGTFEFYVVPDFCDTVRFTNGRFDLQIFEH